jgi:hypothetical protein
VVVQAVNHRLLAIQLTKLGWRKGKFPGAYERATDALSKGCTYAQAAEHGWQWAMRNYTKEGTRR